MADHKSPCGLSKYEREYLACLERRRAELEENRTERRQIEEKYVEHREQLYRLAEGLGLSWDLAEDVVQDVFLHWLSMPGDSSSQPRDAVHGWLRRCTFRGRLDVERRKRRRKAAEGKAAARRPKAQARTPLDELAEKGLLEWVLRVLTDRATDLMNRVFAMRWEGLSYPQIAARMGGMNAEGARNVMRKVLAVLREEMSRLE